MGVLHVGMLGRLVVRVYSVRRVRRREPSGCASMWITAVSSGSRGAMTSGHSI